MSSIICDGCTYHGISVVGRGVFADDYGIATYAGQHRDGYACGLGVTTYSPHAGGDKEYAEHGPDGERDGRHFNRKANGNTFYHLYECGEQKDSAGVFADGTCKYNGEACAPDDPRLLALIAQVAPVEVRPTVPAPNPPLTPQAIVRCGSFCPRRRSRPPRPPRCIPKPHAVAGGRATQANNSRNATIRFDLAGGGSRGQPATALGSASVLRTPSLRTARRGTRPGFPAALN
jgi:hypothetical protein